MNEDETNCHRIDVLAERIAGLSNLVNERDIRYRERFEAQEKAIAKSELSQSTYNQTHNDLSRKMESQYKEMLPRTEAGAQIKALEDKIADLRESRSTGQGRSSLATIVWATTISVGIGLLMFAISRQFK